MYQDIQLSVTRLVFLRGYRKEKDQVDEHRQEKRQTTTWKRHCADMIAAVILIAGTIVYFAAIAGAL